MNEHADLIITLAYVLAYLVVSGFLLLLLTKD
jgi:hypothetical protein